MPTVEEYRAELERLGEDAIRRDLILNPPGQGGDPKRRAVAEDWLRQKEQERRERQERAMMLWTRVAAIAAVIAAIFAAFAWLFPIGK